MLGQFTASLFGAGPKNPEVPDLPRVDAQAVGANTIAANQANLPAAQKLATSVNTFNQEEILRMLKMAMPGFDQMTGQVQGVINDQLAGKVPQGVQDQIQNSAAAKALAGGYGGSGMFANLTARDLGLTSLQLTQQGLNSAQQWLQTVKSTMVAPQFNVASMFDSVPDALAREERFINSDWQRQWTKNQIKAQGSPVNQALWNSLGKFDDTSWAVAGTVASAYAGGALGGAGGGGTGGTDMAKLFQQFMQMYGNQS